MDVRMIEELFLKGVARGLLQRRVAFKGRGVGTVRILLVRIARQSSLHLVNMSSSFWVASDDEWDDDIYSSESDGGEVDLKPTSRFADLDIGSDDEDDEKRVSKSAAEKAWDDLHKSIKVLRSVLLSQGWSRASAGMF